MRRTTDGYNNVSLARTKGFDKMQARTEIDFQERYESLRRIVGAVHWKAQYRVTLAALVIEAFDHATNIAGDDVWLDDLPIHRVATITGLKEDQVQQVMAALAVSGVVIRIKKPRPTDDGGWESKTAIRVPVAPIHQFPWLDKPKGAEDDKKRMKADRDELAKARATLAALVCPHCGEKGEWHAVCGNCGESVDTPAEDHPPDQVPENRDSQFSGVTPATDRDDAGDRDDQTEDRKPGLPVLALVDDDEDDAGDRKPGIPVISLSSGLPILAADSTEDVSISASYESPAVADVGITELPSFETMVGAETVECLDAIGIPQCLVEGTEGPRKPFGKVPIDATDDENFYVGPWNECPVAAAKACGHLKQRGNTGILTGRPIPDAPGLCWDLLDGDYGMMTLLGAWHDLARASYFDRATDRTRRKVLLLVRSDKPIGKRTYEGVVNGERRKIELLAGNNMGVSAGNHVNQYGEIAEIEYHHGAVIEVGIEELDARLRAFTGMDLPTPATTIDPDATVTPCSDYHPTPATRTDAAGLSPIEWWISNPANQAEVDRLLSKCKSAGKYIAIRPDDSHPSTIESKTTAPDGRRIFHDYGTGKSFDYLGMYCQLAGEDQDAFVKGTVVPAWRAAHGLPVLQDKR